VVTVVVRLLATLRPVQTALHSFLLPVVYAGGSGTLSGTCPAHPAGVTESAGSMTDDATESLSASHAVGTFAGTFVGTSRAHPACMADLFGDLAAGGERSC
jgi:hypothetical protein